MGDKEYQEVDIRSDDEEVTFELLTSTENLIKAKSFSRNQTSSPWNKGCIARLFSLFIMFMIAIGFALRTMPRLDGPNQSQSSNILNEDVYTHGAVSAGNNNCSQIGKEILTEGGTAVDAAIAAVLCQGVIEPHKSGLGGGMYLVYFDSNTMQSHVIDARETAPTAALSNNSSIGIPGQLKGLSLAYEKWGGGVSWSRLFEPSIKLLNETHGSARLISTLRTIAQRGSNSFYSGEISMKLINDDLGLTFDDFRNYRAIEREALKVQLSGNVTLIVPPAPSGGPVLAAIMALVDGHQRHQNGLALFWHRTVESFKHAFGFASNLADPDFATDTARRISDYLREDSLNAIRMKEVNTSVDADFYGVEDKNKPPDGNFFLAPSDGSHVSVFLGGTRGGAVSITSSLGGGLDLKVSNSTGIVFNNAMDFFSPKGVNSRKAGKRPRSFMSPCIVTHNNQVYYVIGSSGGKHAPTSTALALIRMMYLGYSDPSDAIQQPLLHNQLFPSDLDYEENFDEKILNQLAKMGHKLHKMNEVASYTNAIKNHGSHIHAYSDTRQPHAASDGW